MDVEITEDDDTCGDGEKDGFQHQSLGNHRPMFGKALEARNEKG